MSSTSTSAADRTKRSRVSSTSVEVVVALGHHRHGDGRPLPEILVVDLGHRDVVAVAQGVDDGPHGGALRLEGPAGRYVQVKAQGSGVHSPILAARRAGHERDPLRLDRSQG